MEAVVVVVVLAVVVMVEELEDIIEADVVVGMEVFEVPGRSEILAISTSALTSF